MEAFELFPLTPIFIKIPYDGLQCDKTKEVIVRKNENLIVAFCGKLHQEVCQRRL